MESSMTIKSFKDDGTTDVAKGANSKKARKVVSQQALKAAKRTLDELAAVSQLGDLKLPGYQLKELTKTKPGYYSIRINDQYRLIFKFENGEASDVEIADYHAGYE